MILKEMMRNRIFTVCILLASFLLTSCSQYTAKVGSIKGMFIAEEEVDVTFYSSSGSEVMTAPTKFTITYKRWIVPQGELFLVPLYGDLAGHRVQNNGNTPLYIFFQVATKKINGQKFHAFPRFQSRLVVGGAEEDREQIQFDDDDDVVPIPAFSAVLEVYRYEANCPDLNDCEYVIIVPPGESRIFRYINE